MNNQMSFSVDVAAKAMGVHKKTIKRRIEKENIPRQRVKCQGGDRIIVNLQDWPADIQSAILIYIKDAHTGDEHAATGKMMDLLPVVSASAASQVLESMTPDNPLTVYGLPEGYGDIVAAAKRPSSINKDSIGLADFKNQKFRARLAILTDLEKMPRDWALGRRKYVEAVAAKHGVSYQQVYKLQKKKDLEGLSGLRHTKSYKGKARKWSSMEPIDYYCGLKLKRAHRKMDNKTIYAELVIEADRRGWEIGSRESAEWWYKQKVSVLMEAYATGGLRQLDNLLPSILRSYADLAPFEMLVGDQHRFDFWAIDDDTLQLVRPECYLWVDLRTRIIYGVAVDRRYDAHLMAQALRHGLISWGAFGSIFTDNGRPELSRHITGILANMRVLGLEWAQTIDLPVDILDCDGDEVQPCVIMPGTHKKAVVKNAKSKLIEREFQEVKRALINIIKLPGYTKDMRGDIHAQDIDQEEVQRLAKRGKLPYLSEFAGAVMEACFHVNKQHHRGIAKEWIWGRPPQVSSPLACLAACCEDGWRPRFLTEEAIDNLLIKREKRIVNKGRISYRNDFYEHDELIHLHGQEVTIGCPDTVGEDVLLVFAGAQYLCTATPVSYSSMKDMNLARKKIIEKRSRRKRIAESVRALTAGIPDMRNYPDSSFEKQAAAISADQRRRAIEHKAETREITQEELDHKVEVLAELNRIPAATSKPLAGPRPDYWTSDAARHDWSILASVDGTLSVEDRAWMVAYEAEMEPEDRARWEFEREYRLQEAQSC